MLKRSAWAVLISALFASVLYTTNGCGGTPTETNFHLATLNGTVTDAVSGQPISGASITVQSSGGSPVTATTLSDGRYFVSAISSGSNLIEAIAPGHQRFSTTKNLNDGANTLDIHLQPNP